MIHQSQDVSRFFEKKDEGGEEDNDDSLDLDDDLSVFKKETAGADLIKVNEDKILFYVDLENERVVVANTKDSDEQADMEEELGSGLHPVLINQYPLCLNHSILLLFAEEGLPQILSDEILALLFQIFRISQNENMRIGYNSMGAECWINNLHFHLVSNDSLFNPSITSIKSFPIESAATKLFFESSLKHNDENEINMFSVGV